MNDLTNFMILFLVTRVDCTTFFISNSFNNDLSLNDFYVKDGEEVKFEFKLPLGKIKSLEVRAGDGLRICKFGHPCERIIGNFNCSNFNSKCFLTIPKFLEKYAGIWDIYTTYYDEYATTLYFTMNRFELVGKYHEKLVTIVDGEFIAIILNQEENPHQLRCILSRNTEREVYDMNEDHSISEIWPIGGCGVRMTVRKIREGKWSLDEIIGYTKRRQEFEIVIRDAANETNHNTSMYEKVWYEKSSAKLEFEISPDHNKREPIYCEVIRPDGFIISLEIPKCYLEIDEVTKTDNGIWQLHSAFADDMIMHKNQFRITVLDPYLITKVDIIDSQNVTKEVIFRCRLHIELFHLSIKTCQWFDPRENLVSTENASKYIILRNEENCDLKLNGLEETDFGRWTCEISLANSSKKYSSAIELSQRKASNIPEIGDHISLKTTFTVVSSMIFITSCLIYVYFI